MITRNNTLLRINNLPVYSMPLDHQLTQNVHRWITDSWKHNLNPEDPKKLTIKMIKSINPKKTENRKEIQIEGAAPPEVANRVRESKAYALSDPEMRNVLEGLNGGAFPEKATCEERIHIVTKESSVLTFISNGVQNRKMEERFLSEALLEIASKISDFVKESPSQFLLKTTFSIPTDTSLHAEPRKSESFHQQTVTLTVENCKEEDMQELHQSLALINQDPTSEEPSSDNTPLSFSIRDYEHGTSTEIKEELTFRTEVRDAGKKVLVVSSTKSETKANFLDLMRESVIVFDSLGIESCEKEAIEND